MNNYKTYLKDKNSIFHQTEKKILNLLNTNDLKNNNKFLSSKIKNRLIDSLLYLHQYKPNCEIRQKFRKKYNLEMNGGKKEMMTLQNIVAPTQPRYSNADLEQQFQEVTSKIFKNQKEHIYPDGDSKLFLNQPQFNFNYTIDRKHKQKQEKEQKKNLILEIIKKSGKSIPESRLIFNEIEKNKRNKLELIKYLKDENINQSEIDLIIKIKNNILEKIGLKQDLDQINQLTDIVTESKHRTSLNYIQTSNQDINNKLMRSDMHNPDNFIFNSMADYNLEFVNMKTQTEQKCKYQLKNENAKKNNELRKKYREYQKYEDLIPIIEGTQITDPNNSFDYIYDVDKLLSHMNVNINSEQHETLFNKLDNYINNRNGNSNIINTDEIKKYNQALLGLQLLYEIENINKNIVPKPIVVDFLKKKLYSPGIKYPKIKNLIQHLGTRNQQIDDTTISKLLELQDFKDDIFLKLDDNIPIINRALSKFNISFLVSETLKGYIFSSTGTMLQNLEICMKIYSYIINNNNSKVDLDNVKNDIVKLLKEIVNKEDLLKEIDPEDTSCKFNTHCGEDNLCHLKKCIYEVLASSGKLKGQQLTGLEIRKTVDEKFKSIYPEHENENFINECNWLDGKVINFLENEYNIRIILINKFDYNFNQELIEYNDFQNHNTGKINDKNKGTLENLDEIKNIKNTVKNIGINFIDNTNMSEALQSKYSVKNKQGALLCNQFKHQELKYFNKVVFIIYNTDQNYQLLKINGKTQLTLKDIPINLKKFVNNSCPIEKPLLKISDSELIENKLDYELLEKKILDYLYKYGLSNNIEKINYFRNLINLYQEQDDIIDINNKLSGITFEIENYSLVGDLNVDLDLRNVEYINLILTRNGKNINKADNPRNEKFINFIGLLERYGYNYNIGQPNNKYSIIIPLNKTRIYNNKIYIESETIKFLNSIQIFNTYFDEKNLEIKVINHKIRTEFLFKLFDFICYLKKEGDDYFNSNLDSIIKNNSYLEALFEKKNTDKEQFLKAFKIYKSLELEKLYNSELYVSENKKILNTIFLTKPNYLFNILNDLIINSDKNNNYIRSSKLFNLNNSEKRSIINKMNELNLEYQYIFSIFIRDFFMA